MSENIKIYSCRSVQLYELREMEILGNNNYFIQSHPAYPDNTDEHTTMRK